MFAGLGRRGIIVRGYTTELYGVTREYEVTYAIAIEQKIRIDAGRD